MGLAEIRAQRTFDLLMMVGTLILPQLTAFPVKLIGWDPLDYSATGMVHTGIALLIIFIISAALGLWWNPRKWLILAAIFYTIYVTFYTTFFTNGQGFFTGIIGSLGYWLSQQGVERGSQPWYYFALVQIPMYEYLGALGTLLALYFGIRHSRFAHLPGFSPARQPEIVAQTTPIVPQPDVESTEPSPSTDAEIPDQSSLALNDAEASLAPVETPEEGAAAQPESQPAVDRPRQHPGVVCPALLVCHQPGGLFDCR